ncbi:hypothetical protein [Nocardia sp. NPDC060249]|uniref:hypothetical protein n=1 Tax=Nocardia sp. NPDC060249 TaxID=3347082 RepID=UPI00364AE291
MAHCVALYDEHYRALRRDGLVPSISRSTWMAYVIAESATADSATGRDCRPTVRRLQRLVTRSKSTIQRCRRLAVQLGVRTVVFRGRHRTKAERLESYDRQDKGRGWASVAALHESTTLAVDEKAVAELLDLGIDTPLPQSGGKSVLSLSAEKKLPEKTEDPAPRPKKTNRSAPIWDAKAVSLARNCRADMRIPDWIAGIALGKLTAVLTPYARAGWLVDDVLTAIEQFRLAGHTLLTDPENPSGYLVHMLRRVPVNEPPARIARGQRVQREHHQRFEQQLSRDDVERAKKTAQSVNSDSVGRKLFAEFREANRLRVSGRAAARMRTEEFARREIALSLRHTG